MKVILNRFQSLVVINFQTPSFIKKTIDGFSLKFYNESQINKTIPIPTYL